MVAILLGVHTSRINSFDYLTLGEIALVKDEKPTRALPSKEIIEFPQICFLSNKRLHHFRTEFGRKCIEHFADTPTVPFCQRHFAKCTPAKTSLLLVFCPVLISLSSVSQVERRHSDSVQLMFTRTVMVFASPTIEGLIARMNQFDRQHR